MNRFTFVKTIQPAFVAVVLLLLSNAAIAQSWDNKNPNFLYSVDKSHDTSNCKVGIGTAHPTEKLEVKGNLKVNGEIFADSIQLSRIVPSDSILHFGHHSVILNLNANRISWSAVNQFNLVSKHS